MRAVTSRCACASLICSARPIERNETPRRRSSNAWSLRSAAASRRPALWLLIAMASPGDQSGKRPLRALPGELLPAANDHVAVLRLELDPDAPPAQTLARNQRRSRPEKRIEDDIADRRAVHHGPFHQGNWL